MGFQTSHPVLVYMFNHINLMFFSFIWKKLYAIIVHQNENRQYIPVLNPNNLFFTLNYNEMWDETLVNIASQKWQIG